jgi:hypothetical protein
MPLTLRRTGLSSPAYADQVDYTVLKDGREIGRIYEDRHSRPELRWFWSIMVFVGSRPGIVTPGGEAGGRGVGAITPHNSQSQRQ